MRKPNRHEFEEERKIDGKLYKSVNEIMYREALKHWDDYMRDKHRHLKETI